MNDSANTASVVVGVLIAVAAYVWMGLALSALFRKAGERGWKAWVPFLNIFVLLELGGLSGWNVLLLLIPVVGEMAVFIILIVAYYRISRSFGYGGGMTVLAALLPLIWFSVLGWGSARWLGGPRRGSLRAANADLDARLGAGLDAVPPAPPVPTAGFAPAPATASPRVAPPAADPIDPAPGLPAAAVASRVEFTPAPARHTDESRSDFAPAPARPAAPAPADHAPSPARPASPAPAPARPAAAPPVDPAPAPARAADEPRTDFVPPPARPAAPAPVASSPTPAPAAARSTPSADPSAPVSAFAPRPPAPAAPPAKRGFDDEFDDLDDEYFGDYSGGDDARVVGTTSAGSPAPGPRRAPISSVPASPASAVARDPWAQPADGDPGDAAEDTSGEVSAVVGAPALGGPMSARSSVSAQRNAPEVPDDGLPDETIVAPRRRPRWMLVPPLGAAIPLTSDVVIVGRRPVADARHPGAQLVPIADETRTMSKTHARLERRDDTWIVTDLASTNGVAVVAEDGAEIEIGESGSATIGERFLLGDAELRLTRTEP